MKYYNKNKVPWIGYTKGHQYIYFATKHKSPYGKWKTWQRNGKIYSPFEIIVRAIHPEAGWKYWNKEISRLIKLNSKSV